MTTMCWPPWTRPGSATSFELSQAPDDRRQAPVKEVLARQAGTVFRTVPLTPRSAQKEVKTRGRHPERLERLATLHVRWGTVTIPRRQYSDTR